MPKIHIPKLFLGLVTMLVIVGWHKLTEVQARELRIKAKFLHCHDGDTCRVMIDDSLWLNVRLAGIDAPEVAGRKGSGQQLGDQSKTFLNTELKDQTVEILQNDLDQYNRPVVEIYKNNILVNEQIVELGLAEAYRGKTKRIDRSKYESAEQRAKEAKRGIWALSYYESPKDYRRKK